MLKLNDMTMSFLRMVHLTLRRRAPAWVHRDDSGGWRHRYRRRGVLVTPTVRGSTWKTHEAFGLGVFCAYYQLAPVTS